MNDFGKNIRGKNFSFVILDEGIETEITVKNHRAKAGSFLIGASIPFVIFGMLIDGWKLLASALATLLFAVWLFSRN